MSIAIPITCVAYWVLPWIASRRRKYRLSRRTAQEFDPFFQDVYCNNPPNKELARIIHQAIALEVRVDATQVYPTDRFDGELGCPWWGSGMDEFLGDSEAGLLFKVGDVPAMINGCVQLLENPDRVRTMGEKGRDKALKQFSEDRIIGLYENLYHRVIET